jgi:branched-subunit amino acid aminotransferase/4-amino-4-deoxychorismate lyase
LRLVTYRATSTAIEQTNIKASTLDEATLQLPGGAYTVFPIFEGGRVVRLDRHLDRMDDSARLLSVDVRLDHAQQRELSRACFRRAGFRSARIRLTLPATEPGVAYISVEKWEPPGEDLYREGVRVVTTGKLRRDNPRAKSTDFVSSRSEVLQKLPEGIYEVILCGEADRLLEGSGSNFYGVRDGALYTAPQTAVLMGVARSIVLDACAQNPALPVMKEYVAAGEIAGISEAMLSSASRGVVPIVEIDGVQVGDGQPGPFFAELRRRYLTIVEAEAELL